MDNGYRRNHKKAIYTTILFFLVLLPPACAVRQETLLPASTRQKTVSPPPVPAQTMAPAIKQHGQRKTMLYIMQTACGNTMETYCYVDMDHDGEEELIGSYSDNHSCYHTWYCSSDGETCLEVHCNSRAYDGCTIELLPLENETHVVINAYNWFGDSKNFTILALHNSMIETVVSDIYGYVYMDEASDIILDIEAYDGLYDAVFDIMIWHTWKDTYLYYDGTTYKQYGASQISEKEFLQFENAEEILAFLHGGNTWHSMEDTEKLELSYWIRSNGILHIQCDQHENDGDIYYYYYTMRYDGDTILINYEDWHGGRMAGSFTSIEATY